MKQRHVEKTDWTADKDQCELALFPPIGQKNMVEETLNPIYTLRFRAILITSHACIVRIN